MNTLSACPVCREDAEIIDQRIVGSDIEVTVDCPDHGEQTFCD